VLGTTRPGRLIAPFRHAWAGSRLGRRAAFGWWGVADPDALEPELAEAFLVGPAHHADPRPAGRPLLVSDPPLRLARATSPRPRALLAPRPAAAQLDPARAHFHGVAPLAVLLPRPRLEPPVDGDPPAPAEVLGAQLRLAVPGRDGQEVGPAVAARAVDREHEA